MANLMEFEKQLIFESGCLELLLIHVFFISSRAVSGFSERSPPNKTVNRFLAALKSGKVFSSRAMKILLLAAYAHYNDSNRPNQHLASAASSFNLSKIVR